jgi:hypothetical protein
VTRKEANRDAPLESPFRAIFGLHKTFSVSYQAIRTRLNPFEREHPFPAGDCLMIRESIAAKRILPV